MWTKQGLAKPIRVLPWNRGLFLLRGLSRHTHSLFPLCFSPSLPLYVSSPLLLSVSHPLTPLLFSVCSCYSISRMFFHSPLRFLSSSFLFCFHPPNLSVSVTFWAGSLCNGVIHSSLVCLKGLSWLSVSRCWAWWLWECIKMWMCPQR